MLPLLFHNRRNVQVRNHSHKILNSKLSRRSMNKAREVQDSRRSFQTLWEEMTAENRTEEKQQCSKDICLPEEVRVKYFPQYVNKFSYDVLPLFEVDDYNKKTMHEASILENPTYREKWKAFMNGMPQTAAELKPVLLSSNKIPIFSNYRRQKVPPEYLASFVGPPTPGSIFRKTK